MEKGTERQVVRVRLHIICTPQVHLCRDCTGFHAAFCLKKSSCPLVCTEQQPSTCGGKTVTVDDVLPLSLHTCMLGIEHRLPTENMFLDALLCMLEVYFLGPISCHLLEHIYCFLFSFHLTYR